MNAIWSRWAPPSERSILTTISYSGTKLTDFCFTISGYSIHPPSSLSLSLFLSLSHSLTHSLPLSLTLSLSLSHSPSLLPSYSIVTQVHTLAVFSRSLSLPFCVSMVLMEVGRQSSTSLVRQINPNLHRRPIPRFRFRSTKFGMQSWNLGMGPVGSRFNRHSKAIIGAI